MAAVKRTFSLYYRGSERMSWQFALMVISPGKRVARISVRLCAEDIGGDVNMTDVMLQGGVLATAWSGHTSEIKFSFEQ